MSSHSPRVTLSKALCLLPMGILCTILWSLTAGSSHTEATGRLVYWLSTWGLLASTLAVTAAAFLPGRSKPLVWAGGACAAVHGLAILALVAVFMNADWFMDADWSGLAVWAPIPLPALGVSVGVACMSLGSLWLDPYYLISAMVH